MAAKKTKLSEFLKSLSQFELDLKKLNQKKTALMKKAMEAEDAEKIKKIKSKLKS